MFSGLSSLRAKEQVKKPPSEQQLKLQAYLAQQYGTDGPGQGEGVMKKKKKKKKREEPAAGAVRILDEDVSGFAAVQRGLGAPEEAEDDEDQPVIANPGEAERLLLLAERERQYYAQEQDGRGWASLREEQGGGAADASPPRRRRHDSPDPSPPRRGRHDSPDASPPRRGRYDSPGASLPRRQRHDSPDASPPRRQRHDSPDASPPRRQRHDSPDASPPRRQRHDSPDASPPRRQRHDSPDASRPRHGRHDSPDASPPRRGGHDSPDASPPRKRAAAEEELQDAAKRQHMMSDGTIAGMVSGRELMAEMQRKREVERKRFEELGKDVTGRGAETVYRDKEGRAVSREEFQAQQAAAKKKVEYESERDLAWGGGLQQRQEAEARAREMREAAAKPFARSRDDRDLDALQRERLRWGDPMAHLVKKKQPLLEEPPPLLEGAHGERLKKSGFVIPQQVPPHSWLRRGVGPPPNRYGIKPGRHWDGVDRSNGFEQKMFRTQNELRRREQEAFQWAQEDM